MVSEIKKYSLNYKTPPAQSIPDQVAHVLWEITFWGFTRDKIAEEREKTKRAAEESVEELKSLDDLRAALDDLE